MKPNLKCFNGTVHRRDFMQEVYNVEHNSMGEAASVKWCQHCGAVVVDREFDGRLTNISLVKMQWPEVTK